MDLPEIDRLVAINQKWSVSTIMLPVYEVAAMSALIKKQEQALADSNLALMEQMEIAQAAAKVSIWVLTREINQYDQDGAYFEAAWPHKPSIDELMQHSLSENEAQRCIETGGGRIEVEAEWYFLNCVHQQAAPQQHAQAALSDDVMRALNDARALAMKNTVAARVPECGDFGAIAQNLDYVVNQIAASVPAEAVQEPASAEDDDLTEQQWRALCWESIRQHHCLPDGIEQRIKASVLAARVLAPADTVPQDIGRDAALVSLREELKKSQAMCFDLAQCLSKEAMECSQSKATYGWREYSGSQHDTGRVTRNGGSFFADTASPEDARFIATALNSLAAHPAPSSDAALKVAVLRDSLQAARYAFSQILGYVDTGTPRAICTKQMQDIDSDLAKALQIAAHPANGAQAGMSEEKIREAMLKATRFEYARVFEGPSVQEEREAYVDSILAAAKKGGA